MPPPECRRNAECAPGIAPGMRPECGMPAPVPGMPPVDPGGVTDRGRSWGCRHVVDLSRTSPSFGLRNEVTPEPLIATDCRPRLHEYLGGTISGLGGFPQGVGGVPDHVHLLVGLKATHCLADVLRELKKASPAWMLAVVRVAGGLRGVHHKRDGSRIGEKLHRPSGGTPSREIVPRRMDCDARQGGHRV